MILWLFGSSLCFNKIRNPLCGWLASDELEGRKEGRKEELELASFV
jgi:hypothetical protein